MNDKKILQLVEDAYLTGNDHTKESWYESRAKTGEIIKWVITDYEKFEDETNDHEDELCSWNIYDVFNDEKYLGNQENYDLIHSNETLEE